MSDTKVVLLGTGTPNIDPSRSGPSVAIVCRESVYIVDFGPGVVRRAIEAGIKASSLTRAFLTHLHSDHTVGYPDLILTPAVVARDEPLEVYGPQGLEKMTENILAAYSDDLRERIEGLEPTSREGYIVNVHEIPSSGQKPIYEDKLVTVDAFPVEHGSWTSFGFKFSTNMKTVVLSGDTAPSDSLIDNARGCDILVHEVYSSLAFQKRPPEWQQYHSSMHTSSYELAEIAAEVRPGILVLYHQLMWGRSEDQLVAEVKEYYDGEVVSGDDLDVF